MAVVAEVDVRRGTDGGLLLVRAALGLIMAAHGAQQLLGWFGGGGIDGTAAFFAASGYSAATLMAVLSGLSHIVGGLALTVGLFTPLACAAIIGTMINAVAVMWGSGFFAAKGGIEYELLLIVATVAVALTGPGRFAVDRGLPVLRENRAALGVAGIVIGVVSGVLVLALFR
nr:DoxX family protein [Kibdelosporangium sp. MJ126-NF4]CEL13605.1 Membrane protein, distant similarity to thiosulphate:quinone oxidoreductase DoxD [Kibdelosporangium sp. MJ126-NF4]CTQ99291.1 Membrane protein, distant similarity to thiosulphate:quinone oxidoreductase DoxD [Kibdelosporangium sp. MJ126-NF4]